MSHRWWDVGAPPILRRGRADEWKGSWPKIRGSLSFSINVLLVSFVAIFTGVCLVVPFGLLVFGVNKLVRRMLPKKSQPAGSGA